VAGIMAALEADDDVSLLGQPIDDLALALVAPLGADHDNVCHEELSPGDLSHRAFGLDTPPQPLRILDAARRSKAKRPLRRATRPTKSLYLLEVQHNCKARAVFGKPPAKSRLSQR